MAKTDVLVTTRGEKGSRILTKDEAIEVPPAHPSSVEDPTGAGDAYRAGFIFGMLNGLPLISTGKLGSTVACYAVEKKGTQAHTFTLDGVQSRYRENFGENLAL